MKKFKCKKCGKIYNEAPEACECGATEFEEVTEGDPTPPGSQGGKENIRALIAEAVNKAKADFKAEIEALKDENKELKSQLDLVGLNEAEKAKKLKELQDAETQKQLAEYSALKAKNAAVAILAERKLPISYAP